MSVEELKSVNGIRHNVVLGDTYLFVPIKEVFDAELNAMFVQELKRFNPKVHVVRSGDNMYAIANKYGMSLYELMSMNKDINPNRIKPGQSVIVSNSFYNERTARKATTKKYAAKTKSDGFQQTSHKVKSGESLWSIATKYGTTISQIKQTNGLKSNNIHAGQHLKVFNFRQSTTASAKSGRYTVQDGDSLWVIAKKFGTSVSRIKQKNNISGNNIHPGNVLYID
jgi:LysM repeat protein